MQVRSIILGALGVIVAVVFLKLVVDSQGSKKASIDEAELEKALSEYSRNEKKASQAAPVPRTPSTLRNPRPKTSTSKTSSSKTSDTGNTTSAAQPFTAPPPLPDKEDKVDEKAQMDDANRLYDRADYEGSREAALELLAQNPDNVRMTRIVVSSSCIMGDEEVATKHYSDLPARDQRQMARRCKRYGIEFDDQDQ